MIYSLVGLLGINYFEVIFSQFTSKSMLPIINGLIYASVFGYLTFFETKIIEEKVYPLFTAGAAHIIILSTIYNLTKNANPVLWIASCGGYLLAGIASLFFLDKIQNKVNQ